MKSTLLELIQIHEQLLIYSTVIMYLICLSFCWKQWVWMYHCPWTYTPIIQITRYSSHRNIIQNCLAFQSTWVRQRFLVEFMKLNLFFPCVVFCTSLSYFLRTVLLFTAYPFGIFKYFSSLKITTLYLNINFAPIVSQFANNPFE